MESRFSRNFFCAAAGLCLAQERWNIIMHGSKNNISLVTPLPPSDTLYNHHSAGSAEADTGPALVDKPICNGE